MVPGDPTAGSALVVTAHLAAFHSLFNVTNTLVMLPSSRPLVTRWVPKDEEEGRVSRYLSAGIVETPELFLLQARQEMRRMAETVVRIGGPVGGPARLEHPTQSGGMPRPGIVKVTVRQDTSSPW